MSQTEYNCGTAGEITPCPFCGNEAVIGRSKRAVTVGCDFNDCPSRECYSAGKLEDEPSVIAAWNTRAHPSTIPAADTDRVWIAVEASKIIIDNYFIDDDYDANGALRKVSELLDFALANRKI